MKAGALLYQIDPAPYQAAYDQAKASLAMAEANVPAREDGAAVDLDSRFGPAPVPDIKSRIHDGRIPARPERNVERRGGGRARAGHDKRFLGRIEALDRVVIDGHASTAARTVRHPGSQTTR